MTEYVKKSDVIDILKFAPDDILFDAVLDLESIFIDESGDIFKDEFDSREGLAEQVTEKMEYMCGCLNCINTVSSLINKDFKPRVSSCEDCHRKERCNSYKTVYKKED